jgi:DNA-binding MarR family transcriptional regulator
MVKQSTATASIPEKRSSTATELTPALVDVFIGLAPAFKNWSASHSAGQPVSWAGIRLLRALDEDGPQIMSELSQRLAITPRAITSLVDRLEHEGMARRQPHPTDRRATVIELTRQGADACSTGIDEQRSALADLFESLTEKDRRELLRLFEKLQRLLAVRR